MFRGHVLRSVGDDPGALAAYRHAAKLDPDAAAAQNMIGVQLRVAGEPAAEEAFGLARALDPQLLHTDINLGLVAQSRQDWAGALTRFERAARANPAFLYDHWDGRLERDPFRSFYSETVFGYAGLGYHTGYCRMRADGAV
jgi:tetratricopeptide (TPR) repeat protein